jgi:hypothetical protein
MKGEAIPAEPAHMPDYRVITAGFLRQNAQISPK